MTACPAERHRAVPTSRDGTSWSACSSYATVRLSWIRACWPILIAATLLAPAAARATDIEVHVRPVDRKPGVVRVEACTRAEFLKDCSYNASATAHPGEDVIVIRGVPPGMYAVIAYHDINNNGIVDQDALGMPEEGVGFSNDPLMLLGPPTFVDTSVAISGSRVRVDVRLRFEP